MSECREELNREELNGKQHRAPAGRGAPANARSRAVEELGRRIVAGQIVPGEPFDHRELERELGVGRSSLREALMVLTAKGLLEAKQGFGTYVADRNAWNLLDPDLLRWRIDGARDEQFLHALAELRTILEPAAARLAATKHTDADLAELESALDQMTRSGLDFEGFIEADIRLHSALLCAAHNELMADMAGVISLGLRVRNSMIDRSERWIEATVLHSRVVEAIRFGLPDLAEASMRALVERGCKDEEQAKHDDDAVNGEH